MIVLVNEMLTMVKNYEPDMRNINPINFVG